MTTLIPDSWELPRHLAGDLIPMDEFREQGLSTIPEDQEARVFDFNRAKKQIKSRPPKFPDLPVSPATSRANWEIEPFDPAKFIYNEPPELYSQATIDHLERSGFQPFEKGIWHRPVTTDHGENLGASHFIAYQPGYKDPNTGARAPWYLATDPDEAGQSFRTLRGPYGALAAADKDVEQIRRMPKQAQIYLFLIKTAVERSRNAGDWLENNPESSFQALDPREEARHWMDEHAHEYLEWHPTSSDYTYSDFTDATGQTFRPGEEEGTTYALPGSHHHQSWEGEDHGEDGDLSEEEAQRDADHNRLEELEAQCGAEHDRLEEHGFKWEPWDSTAGTHENPLTPETPGKWVRHQHDLEGNHVATHTITDEEQHRLWGDSPRSEHAPWVLKTEVGEHGLPVSLPTSAHGGLDYALYKYKQNSAEAMLPKYGYEPAYSRVGGTHYWSKTDPSPEGRNRHEDYQHEIFFPDESDEFNGLTINSNHIPGGSYHHANYDLADVVREQRRVAQGKHPGGRMDNRLGRDQFLADPSVFRLGAPRDHRVVGGLVNNMEWGIPTPEHPHGVTARANYNWDTGDYDFNYAHHGIPLDPTHHHVPEGAPVTIPGRQPQLPIGGMTR